MGSSLNVALPQIGSEFGLDAVGLSWVPTSYLLAAAVILVPFGRLADIHGRKRIFSLGVLLYTAASGLCAFAPSGSVLIAGRALQGMGGAMTFGTGVAILTSVFPPEERGRVLGINTAAVYVGLSIGPFLGGAMTETFGWRSIFLANLPLGIAMLVILRTSLRGEWADARGATLDIPGSVVYSASLVALMIGFSRLPGGEGWGLILAGFSGMALFVRIEARAASPLIQIQLFRGNRVFAFSNLAALINYSATFAVGFLLSLYLQYVRGMSPRQAGFVLVAQPVIMALGSPYAGRLSDRIEPRVLASLGMGGIAVGLLLFVFLTETTPVPLIVAGLVVLGAGFSLFSSPNANAVMGSVEKNRYGVASGTLATMRLSGQMLSIGIAMLVFALVLGREQIGAANAPRFLLGVRIAFGVFVILSAAGVFASLARGKIR
jgi:EmrB/QacA subfamily drug resistance transporter